MTTQILVTEEYGRNSAKKMLVHETEQPNFEGRLALDLIIKWGMITATISGEDSAGRSKLVDLAPKEVVDRACEMADLTCKELRVRGWMVTAPDVSELLRKTDD